MGVAQASAISPQWKSALWQFEFVGRDTTPPQISTLTVPTAGSTVTEIDYLKGDCSDNIGGSGVKRVGVQFVRVNTINQSWNWEAQTWGPDDGADDKVKSAKFNPTGTSWTIEDQLPPASELPDGKYRTVLTTYDFAGNPYYGLAKENTKQFRTWKKIDCLFEGRWVWAWRDRRKTIDISLFRHWGEYGWRSSYPSRRV